MVSSSDSAMFQALVERVERLEAKVYELLEKAQGKDLHGDLYGPEVNHTEEREARRGPGRPPGPRPG